jgi:beta-lactamase superfamily II metal-dependent hydrolase
MYTSSTVVDIYALDAGHGACTLIFVTEGRSTYSLMVDCGTMGFVPDYRERLGRLVDRAKALIKRDAANRLDALIASHTDMDHIGGINSFLKSFSDEGGTVGTVFYNRDRVTNVKGPQQFFDDMAQRRAEQNFDTDFTKTRLLYEAASCKVRIVAPEHMAITGDGGGSDANELSGVVHVSNGQASLIVCGDASAERLNQLDPTVREVDVVLAPHHGGFFGNETAAHDAYQLLAPSVVVCSAGRKTRLCPDHLNAVHRSNAAFMCTSGNEKCQLATPECAGEVWIRLTVTKPVSVSPTVVRHRVSVSA